MKGEGMEQRWGAGMGSEGENPKERVKESKERVCARGGGRGRHGTGWAGGVAGVDGACRRNGVNA